MQNLRNLTKERHTTWTDDKWDNKPHYYSDDIDKLEIIDGSFKYWKKDNGEIYLSTWYVKN